MRIDRVADNIYVFASDLYAQVTCTVVLTPEGAIVIDTLPFPSETREVLLFLQEQAGARSVRYVFLTHHHADHVYGTYLFDGAQVVSQALCRSRLLRVGRASLDRARRQTPALLEVELVVPSMVFDQEMHLHVGEEHLELMHLPGHAPDNAGAYIHSEKLLVAGDAIMPVPHVVGGDVAQLKETLVRIRDMKPSFVVQGHGTVLLRGEVEGVIDESLAYLDLATAAVQKVIDEGQPPSTLREIEIEACGLSRIPLDGAVTRLHLANLIYLYKQMTA